MDERVWVDDPDEVADSEDVSVVVAELVAVLVRVMLEVAVAEAEGLVEPVDDGEPEADEDIEAVLVRVAE